MGNTKRGQVGRGARGSKAVATSGRSPLPGILLIIVVAILAVGAVAIFKPQQWFEAKRPVPAWLHIDKEFSSVHDRNIIVEAATAWNDRFGCGREVTIHRWVVDVHVGQTLVEQASRGEIWADPAYDIDGYDMRDSVLHAMTHACGGDDLTTTNYHGMLLDDQGTTIETFIGLTLRYSNPQGQIGSVSDFEEGAAELLAGQIDGYTHSNHRAYIHWYTVMQSLQVSPDVVWAAQKSSDLPGFVIAALHKQGPMSADELKQVLNEFYVENSPNAP